MTFVFGMNLRQWGFDLNKWRASLRTVGWFVLVFFGVVIMERLPGIISGTAPSLDYPLTASNMAGVLGSSLLVIGTCEEPLFRGLVMTVLGKYWRGTYRIAAVEIPSVAIVATIFFLLAHISFTFSPFTMTHVSLYQQLCIFVLGLYWAVVFYRTGSLLGPIVMHNYANGLSSVVRDSMAFLCS